MRRWLAAAAFILLAAPALAQEDGQGDPGGDVLLFRPPDGWSPAQQEKADGVYRILYLPDGSTIDDWRLSLTARIFFNLSRDRPDLSAADFTENLVRFYGQACSGGHASPQSSYEEDGYDVAVRVVSCPRSVGEDLGSVSMIKVMRGEASFFVLERVWRGPPFAADADPVPQATFDTWAEFLSRSRLCNTTLASRPCPAGVAP
ncbi:MAG: hypothetical protein QGF53_12350 [Alphaproteobacteria bacterium]|nr:hypothetical protein [Alphaproteobacteria bacterium]